MQYVRVLFLFVAAAILTAASVGAQMPYLISYQGRLTETDGTPVPDGDYNMTFQIVEHDPPPMGELPLWSSGVRSVSVTDGLFVYYLGSNVPLPPLVFTHESRESHYVRVLPEGSLVASSGIRVAAVPFAFKAIEADTADYAHASPGGAASGWVDDGSVVRLASGGDRVGIGTSSPSEPLVVGGDLGSFPEASYVVSCNPNFEEYSGYKLGFNSDNHATLQWNGDGDQLKFNIRAMGTSYNSNLVLRAGNVGVGVDYPTERLVVGRDMGSFSGEMIVIGNNVAGRYSGVKFGEDADNCGNMIWNNDNNYMYFVTKENGVSQDPIYIRGGRLSIGEASPFAQLTAKGSGTCGHFENSGSFGGNVILAKANNPSARGIRAWATNDDGIGVQAEADGTYGIAVNAEASGSHAVAISAEATGSSGVALVARGAPTGKAAHFYGNVVLYSDEDESMVMELGEGLDYAEGFDTSDPLASEPGTVMSIDPINPGSLMVCQTAYDSKVAGIVAGANNLGSGVRLGAESFDLDIALAGRVYCNVEAADGDINPGDLLTTSATPGYAMKATDYHRAQGAILGKAMEPLKKGETGQILVLVTLQ